MKTTKIFLMAALALTFAACSNDDNDIQTTPQPAKAEGITITATLAPKSGSASTRKVTDGTDKIVAEWAANEHIAILYTVGSDKKVADAEITSVNEGVATITFAVDGSTVDGTACQIVYPLSAAKADNSGVKAYADMLAAQDGVLDGDLDVRVGAGTIQTSTPSLTVTTQPEAQNAIFKLTLSGQSIDATHPLVIKKGENDVVTTVTPASSTTSVYVAMPPAASSTYRFIVTTDNNKYIKSGTAAITAGKYYQTTLDLSTARYPLALSSATVDDLGSVIASDGNIYLKNAATPSGNTAVAMIAYKSETAGKSLAIQLNASPASMDWSAACSYSSYPSITGNPGTWRLPSKADWQNMFVGCAKSGDAGAGNFMNPIAGFKEKIEATGITWKQGVYWSSTDSGSKAWDVGVYINNKFVHANFVEQATSKTYSVLGCLAF